MIHMTAATFLIKKKKLTNFLHVSQPQMYPLNKFFEIAGEIKF